MALRCYPISEKSFIELRIRSKCHNSLTDDMGALKLQEWTMQEWTSTEGMNFAGVDNYGVDFRLLQPIKCATYGTPNSIFRKKGVHCYVKRTWICVRLSRQFILSG